PERPPNDAILSERGELIANRGDTGGRAIDIEDLPAHVPNAVIAIEDRRFRSHFGVDPIGLARAMIANVRAAGFVQGGSTLTQQLAKNLFLNPSRTIGRKVQEMILAVSLEWRHSKDEILEMYLNRVYFGAGAYGVDAAARRYFAKGAEDLSVSEAAVLAGLLRAPSYYAPTRNIDRANARGATVLAAMLDIGAIDDLTHLAARENPAQLRSAPVADSGGYVADWVAAVLPGYIGTAADDVIVETSVNLELQELAQNALAGMLDEEGQKKGVSQGAVVVLDAAGAVKALVGGREYDDSQYNRAVSARRQPGSAFKPFVYLAALEAGASPNTERTDGPTTIGRWNPQNYSGSYLGPVTLAKALAFSLNTIAAQLTAEVGPGTVAAVARRLGIRSQLTATPSIGLGASEVTLLELTNAYVPFSNGGVGVEPHVIRRVRTAEGILLYERRPRRAEQVLSQRDMASMNAMMSAALTSGTAKRASLNGWQAAGKTGTSQDWRDAWFIGYTAFFTAGVWLGNDDNSPTNRATGGSLPAALWRTLMTNVHTGMRPAELPGAGAIALPASDTLPSDLPWSQNVQPAARSGQDHFGAGARDWIPPRPSEGGIFSRIFGR
ncbi:MAG: PBP1A family penicillin-binding protein, partial [Pseudomonadota bacterium]